MPLVLPLAFLALFYFYPLASILRVSFAAGGGWAALADVGRSQYVWGVLGFTVGQAALSTALTLVVGLPGAYLVARYRFPGKSLLRALTAIPFVLPTLVVAAAFNALLGPRGWINVGLMALLGLPEPPIEFVNTLVAILAAHVFYNTTIVVRLVGDFWARLDPRLTQAARVLGADRRRAFWNVTAPLLAPALLAAAMLVFIFDFTSFGVILVLGGPQFATLEVEIYRQTINFFDLPTAAILSLLQLACTLGLTVIYSRLSARLTVPLAVRPQTYTQRRLAGWRERALAGIVVGFLVAFLLFPLASLALRSVTKLEATRGERGAVATGLTLDFYRELSLNRRGALFFAPPLATIGNSLQYASLTVLLSLALGLPTAWALTSDEWRVASDGAKRTWRVASDARPVTRHPSPVTRLLDPLLMLPLGTSAVTLGFGFLVAFNRPPLELRASPLLIPLAHTLVAFPFVVRSLLPAWRSIRPRLRHAAAILGASAWRAWREIDLPLVGRAAFVAAAFAFTISLGEFGATALIARPEYPTVPIAIYRFLSQPGALNYGQALALSTLLMLVCAAGILAIERLRVGEIGEF